MLDGASLEIAPPYLRTPWKGLDSGKLKGGYRVTSEDIYFLFLIF